MSTDLTVPADQTQEKDGMLSPKASSTTALPSAGNNSNDNDNDDDEAVAQALARARGPGMAPIKREHLRLRADGNALPKRVALDGASAVTRGMNKGCEREHGVIERSGNKPTFEGEKNFLDGPLLAKFKNVLRGKKAIITSVGWTGGSGDQNQSAEHKRPREEEEEEGGDNAVTKEDNVKDDDDREPTKAVGSDEAAAALTENRSATAASAPEDFASAARSAVAAVVAQSALGAVQKKDDEPASRRHDRLFKNKVILAPLTTVGNLPFRRICKKFGVDVTVGEMAMCQNLNQTQRSEWSLLRRHESEDIFGVQIAAGRAGDAAITAALLEASDFSYDYVDINCGCPVDLMVNRGLGFGLWERRGRLRGVVDGLLKYQSKPVTIKTRIGADMTAPTLHKYIGDYEKWGLAAVTIHGRSRKQRYQKLANWEYVNDTAAPATTLPVIGNGDIFSWEDLELHKAQHPRVDSHMVGRGALVKPWLFQELKTKTTWDIRSSERLDILRDFCDYGLAHWGADERGVATTRRYLCEWLSFLCRYIPAGVLERLPQGMNDRPPPYYGRDDLETLMASDSVTDWIKISEMLLGPAGDKFKFTPKHKSNSYTVADPNEGGKQVEERAEG